MSTHKTAKRPRAPEDLIVYHVESPDELDEAGVYSEEQTISGFPWKANVTKEKDGDGVEHLGIFLHSEMSSRSSMWFCDVAYELILVNLRDPQLSVTIQDTHRFDYSARTGIGCSRVITMEKTRNPEEGFMKDDMITVEIKVTVNNSSLSRKFRSKACVDLRSPSPQGDTILIVDSTKFYVNKQLLALQSPYFDKLFNGKFKESKQKEIPIEDVDESDFEELLKAMYPIEYVYSDDEVESMLDLADRFEVNNVLNNVEKFLISNSDMTTSRKLLLADKYKLTVLIDRCLSSYKSCADIKAVIDAPEYPLLSEAVKSTFFEMLAKLCKC